MDPNTKISFVMPGFNCANTIAEAVESIMKTNFRPDDELIIINDGSTDDTKKIILELQKKYPQIQTINNIENIGCPATRNIGVRLAKNPLIFNMDADDVLEKDSVAPLQEYLVKTKADISAFSESRYFQKNTKKVTHKWVTKGGILTLADFLSGHITPGGNFLYTKASWEKIGGYSEYGKGLHEFWGFTLKQLGYSAKLVVLEGSYYFHRYGTGDSLFVRESKKINESGIMATKMIAPFFDLLRDEDIEYIKNNVTWFDNLALRPIRLKTGETGQTGQKIILKRDGTITDAIKKLIPKPIFKILKKMYHYIE